MRNRKEHDEPEKTVVIMVDKPLDMLKFELIVIEKEVGKRSFAAATLCHRIGLELRREGLSEEAEQYFARAKRIMQKYPDRKLPDQG